MKKVKEMSKPLPTNEGFPQVYQVPLQLIKNFEQKKIFKYYVGPPSLELKDNLNILIVGQTGSGKTTFLNGAANYLFGVTFEDNCRFKIVVDGQDSNEKKNDPSSKPD